MILFQGILNYVLSTVVIAVVPQDDFMQGVSMILMGLISSTVAFFIAIGALKVIRDEDWIAKEGKQSNTSVLRYIPAVLLSQIFVTLWTLLFIIPGFIKAYAYSMVPYIVKDHQSISAKEAITRSREMMDGRKLDLFIINITYNIIPFLLSVGGLIAIGGFFFKMTETLWGNETAVTFDSSFLGYLFIGFILILASLIFAIRNYTRFNVATAIFYEHIKEIEEEPHDQFTEF